MSKVSVVVPIYNVEQYLEKCIESIANQTYDDLEIILVDDGSTDSSPSICDKWKELDHRVIVIHKENGGLSSARNAGLEVASGQYIMFEDSDDWLDLDIIKKSVERIENDNSDLVIFGYKKIDENGNALGEFTFGNKTFSNQEMSCQLHRRILEMSFGYAWNKLYRLSTIQSSNLKNDGSIIDREDLYFNLCLFNYMNRISFINKVGYYYLQRKSSLLHNSDLARLKGIDIFYEKIKKIALGNREDEKKVINMVLLHYLSDVIIKNIIWNTSISKREKIQNIKNILGKIRFKKNIYRDSDNPKFLNVLYYSILKERPRVFYYYVKLSDFKNKL